MKKYNDIADKVLEYVYETPDMTLEKAIHDEANDFIGEATKENEAAHKDFCIHLRETIKARIKEAFGFYDEIAEETRVDWNKVAKIIDVQLVDDFSGELVDPALYGFGYTWPGMAYIPEDFARQVWSETNGIFRIYKNNAEGEISDDDDFERALKNAEEGHILIGIEKEHPWYKENKERLLKESGQDEVYRDPSIEAILSKKERTTVKELIKRKRKEKKQ